jgi:mannose-6-phosphate isomerase
MTDAELYPLRFKPMFQYRLWGGRALGEFMGAELPGEDPVGEAWLLSDRKEFASPVDNGPLAGETLTTLMQTRKGDLLGRQADRFQRFPLLLKFLDVEKMLSVQVHPRDDQKDLIPEGDTGKTEAWIVLKAKPKAKVYAGLEPGTTAEDLRTLTKAKAEAKLAGFSPRPGQAVQIEAGTVHTLGDGVMVFEVQENSDVTFRLYDWDHVDAKTGKPRPLQVDEALASVDFDRGPVQPVEPAASSGGPPKAQPVFHNAYFDLARWQGEAPFQVGAKDEARVLVCVDGAGEVQGGAHTTTVARGDVVLLPAAVGQARFSPRGSATILEIAIPEAA